MVSNSQVDNFHLSFMEDFLPVGMAILDRAKKGGASKVFEGLSSDNPMAKLRGEGSASAKLIRQKLDEISPGLGNPAFEVEVSETPPETNYYYSSDYDTLAPILRRIDDRLNLIKSHLDDPID